MRMCREGEKIGAGSYLLSFLILRLRLRLHDHAATRRWANIPNYSAVLLAVPPCEVATPKHMVKKKKGKKKT